MVQTHHIVAVSCLFISFLSLCFVEAQILVKESHRPSARNKRDVFLDELDRKIARVLELQDQERKEAVNEQNAKINKLESLVQSLLHSGIKFRTCGEILEDNSSMKSGMYWIDPDGHGIGDDPIYVYCDMTIGTTSILHDSEDSINIGHCKGPGCYARPIVYSATPNQIKSLTELSTECQQSIRYDCTNAPFVMAGITYSWWNDRDGRNQTFWSGSRSTEHTCQCGIDGNCKDPALNCNCDSVHPNKQFDAGVITNKDILPITRLNFGRILDESYGRYTLGRLTCKGQDFEDGSQEETNEIMNATPSSCKDLKRIGHGLSGFYSIKGKNSIDMVHCNFAKPLADPEFEKRVGQVGMTSSPVYFEAYKNAPVRTEEGIIEYNGASINMGGAMNYTNGTFTAPRKGTYLFIFTGYAFQSGNGNGFIDVDLMLNQQTTHRRATLWVNQEHHLGDSAAIQSILELNVGDQVHVEVVRVVGANFYDNNSSFNRFSGLLLREDVV